jgi:hypothetical protein
LLLEAYDCAQELECDPWQFAVELDVLRSAGLTNSQLRWLLQSGYVNHAQEQNDFCHRTRRFRRIPNLSLPAKTCVVLTPEGVGFVGAAHGGGEAARGGGVPGRPVWDHARRELRVGQVVVKRFKQPAGNQELVLEAFEEEGWPPRIDDPLPPVTNQDGKRRLQSTIWNLNRSREARLIRFEGGGNGQSICWREGEEQVPERGERGQGDGSGRGGNHNNEAVSTGRSGVRTS